MTDDDRDAVALLAALRDAQAGPAGPGRTDVARAIVRGRRRILLRRLVGAAAAAGTTSLILVAAPLVTAALRPDTSPDRLGQATPSPSGSSVGPTVSQAPPDLPRRCTVSPLPVPSRVTGSTVTGVDPTGRFIIGSAYVVGVSSQTLIWDDGKMERVDLPGTNQALVDVNSAGLVIGVSNHPDDPAMWVYRDGSAARLRGDSGTIAVAVGESGSIVGQRRVGGARTVPVIWRSPDARAEDLALPGSKWGGDAADIAPDGTVVGTVYLDAQGRTDDRGYVWAPDGQVKMLDLPVIDGVRATGFQAHAIDGDWVSGEAARSSNQADPDSVPVPVRVNLRTGAVETYRHADKFQTSARNRHGWLAGSTGPRLDPIAAVQSPRTLVQLPRERGLVAHVAAALSDDGRVVAGHGQPDNETTQALVWRCR